MKTEKQEAIQIAPKGKQNPNFIYEVKANGIIMLFDEDITTKAIVEHIKIANEM